MFIRKYWIPILVFTVAIVGVSLYLLSIQTPQEVIKIYKPVEPLPKSEVKAPVGETSQGGHIHADGTWHEGPHDAQVEQQPIADNASQGGHWSDAYLPPIEELEVTYADDTDAMFIIDRVKILLKHQRDGFGHNPDADKAFAEMMNFTNEIISSIGTEKWSPQRSQELLKLRWYIFDTPPSSVIFENEGGIVE